MVESKKLYKILNSAIESKSCSKVFNPAVEGKKVAEKSKNELRNYFNIKNIFQEKLFFSGWKQKVFQNLKPGGWKQK